MKLQRASARKQVRPIITPTERRAGDDLLYTFRPKTNMNTNSLRRAACALSVLFLLTNQLAFAQQAQPSPPPRQFELTVDSIMRGPRLYGYQPTGVYWSQDSQHVYFRWKQADEPRLKEMSLYVVNRDGTGLRRLSDDEARQAPPARMSVNCTSEPPSKAIT